MGDKENKSGNKRRPFYRKKENRILEGTLEGILALMPKQRVQSEN